MIKWPLLFFVAALIAAVLGFTSVAAAATNVAILLFFVFAALFVLSVLAKPARRTFSGFAGALSGVVLLTVVALMAVWTSDHYSLESAGAELDDTLAEARADLQEFVEHPRRSTNEARENVADALDGVEEVIDPDDENLD